jgi:hypothetical protein
VGLISEPLLLWDFGSLQKKYRQPSDRLKFTSVTDSPDMVHAKNSYQQCSEVNHPH